MPSKCSAPTCDSGKGQRLKGISFFSFPKEPAVRAAWLRLCGLTEKELTRHPVLCSLHFGKDDVVSMGDRFRLKKTAVPKITEKENTFVIPSHPPPLLPIGLPPEVGKVANVARLGPNPCLVSPLPIRAFMSACPPAAARPLSPPPLVMLPRPPKCVFKFLGRLSTENYPPEPPVHPTPEVETTCPTPEEERTCLSPEVECLTPEVEITYPTPQVERTLPTPQEQRTLPTPQVQRTIPCRQVETTCCPMPCVQRTFPCPQVGTTCCPTPCVQRTFPTPQVQRTFPTPLVQRTFPCAQVQTTCCPTPYVQRTFPTPQVETTCPTPQVETTCPTPQVETTCPTPQVETTCLTPQVETTCPTPQVETTCPTPQEETTRLEARIVELERALAKERYLITEAASEAAEAVEAFEAAEAARQEAEARLRQQVAKFEKHREKQDAADKKQSLKRERAFKKIKALTQQVRRLRARHDRTAIKETLRDLKEDNETDMVALIKQVVDHTFSGEAGADAADPKVRAALILHLFQTGAHKELVKKFRKVHPKEMKRPHMRLDEVDTLPTKKSKGSRPEETGPEHSNDEHNLQTDLNDGRNLQPEHLNDGPSLQPEHSNDGPSLQPEHSNDGPSLQPEHSNDEHSLQTDLNDGRNLQPEHSNDGPSLQPEHSIEEQSFQPEHSIEEHSLQPGDGEETEVLQEIDPLAEG